MCEAVPSHPTVTSGIILSGHPWHDYFRLQVGTAFSGERWHEYFQRENGDGVSATRTVCAPIPKSGPAGGDVLCSPLVCSMSYTQPLPAPIFPRCDYLPTALPIFPPCGITGTGEGDMSHPVFIFRQAPTVWVPSAAPLYSTPPTVCDKVFICR